MCLLGGSSKGISGESTHSCLVACRILRLRFAAVCGSSRSCLFKPVTVTRKGWPVHKSLLRRGLRAIMLASVFSFSFHRDAVTNSAANTVMTSIDRTQPTTDKPPYMGEESTSASLLDGLREESPEAWSRFTDIWTPLIYRRCRRLGCSSEAARDIAQNVLLRVFRGFPGFSRDGKTYRLRYWIQGILRREIAEFFRRNGDLRPTGGSEFQVVMANIPVLEDEEESGDWFEPAQILARALDVVRQDVEPHNWQAFKLIYFESYTPAEAAEKLGREPASIRQATRRIRKKLEFEVEAMLR